jgi:hypothetical protein
MATIAAVPANSHPLAWLPVNHAGADPIDHSRYLMARDARILKPRKSSLFNEGIAVANATGKDLDTDRSDARLGYRPFNDFKRSVGARDLHDTHRRHAISPLGFWYLRGITGAWRGSWLFGPFELMRAIGLSQLHLRQVSR